MFHDHPLLFLSLCVQCVLICISLLEGRKNDSVYEVLPYNSRKRNQKRVLVHSTQPVDLSSVKQRIKINIEAEKFQILKNNPVLPEACQTVR